MKRATLKDIKFVTMNDLGPALLISWQFEDEQFFFEVVPFTSESDFSNMAMIRLKAELIGVEVNESSQNRLENSYRSMQKQYLRHAQTPPGL